MHIFLSLFVPIAGEGIRYGYAVFIKNYRQVSNIRDTLVGNKNVNHSDTFGAAPTTSSFST